MNPIEPNKIDQIISKYTDYDGALIQILLDVQQEYNWVPSEAADLISDKMDVPITQIYRVASFYKSLSLRPRGKHLIKVCLGTACYVRGGGAIMDRLKRVLEIEDGGTTKDMMFTLESVNCIGCCALGPMMTIDGEYYGNASPNKVDEVLKNYD